MAYLDYSGLSYFKSLLDETYLRTSYTGDTTIAGDVTFTGDTVFSEDITGNVDGKAKKDWRGQQIDSTYIKDISTNDNVGQIVYTKGDGTSNYIMIDMMQGATASTAGKAGLVPAPTISERTKFLRGDGEWSVPTDIYVTQNLINTNDSFPILIGATAGATESQVGTAIAFGTKVSVNPNTHALIADHLILKHPTYRRSNNVSSKVMYTLNFADSDDGNGNNLSEIYGYIDPVANGGEHELGFRLFGNPNVQGVEEIFTYLSVGLSKTNIPYGHAPSTPLPADHNEGTDIITRDWLARNGSETGLVHTSMDETIGGIKTFTAKTVNNSSAGIVTTKLTASDKITGTGTAEISGGSSNTPSLKVTGNETVTGDLNVGGNETVTGNISTANGTVSAKTGSIGTGGLTVTGPSNLNGKVTAGNGLDVTGNETVSGNLIVDGTTATDDLSVTDDATIGDTVTIGGQVLKKTGTNTTQEYVSYVTNQQETRNTIITNVVKPNGGLAIVNSGTDKGKIYVKAGNALEIDSNGFVNVDFSKLPPEQVKSIVDRMVDPDGAIIGSTQERIPAGETYHYYDNNGNLVSAVAPAGGIANPNYGKLTVDFSKLSPSQIEAIVLAMIAQDNQGNLIGGLATNSSGKLVVDFSQIDEDTKNEIIKDLKMQIPLAAPLHMYVDQANGNDTIIKNRGISLLPFKTIQACVNYVTNTYSFGNFNGYIHVNAGTYEEHLVLPEFNHARGKIIITGTAQDTSSTIIHSRNGGNTVSCNGGEWDLEYFHLKHESVETVPVTSIVESCVVSSGNGILNLQSNKYEYYYHANYTNDNHYHDFRMISADDKGSIHLRFGNVESVIIFENRTGSYTYGLCALRAGTVLLVNYDGLNTNVKTVYNCSGPCTVFAYATSRGFISNVSGSTRKLTFVPDENNPVTGMRYRCNSGGAIGVARETGIEAGKIFPGSDDIEPFIDSASFCWYKD